MQSRSRVPTVSFQELASSGSGSSSSLASVEDGSSAWERRTRRRRRRLVPRPNPAPSPPVVTTVKTTLGQTPHCHWCKEGHWLKSCPRFLQLSISERINYLGKYNRCNQCTMHHKMADCRVNVRCDICHERHDSSLHDAFQPRLRS